MVRELEDVTRQELWCWRLALGFNSVAHFLQNGLSHQVQPACEGFMLDEDLLCSSALCQGHRRSPHASQLQHTPAIMNMPCLGERNSAVACSGSTSSDWCLCSRWRLMQLQFCPLYSGSAAALCKCPPSLALHRLG